MVLLSAVAAMGAAQAFGQQHGLQRLVPADWLAGPATDALGNLQLPVRYRACQGHWTIRY